MRNIKLLVEYDGTDFVGWQIQAQGRSVQEELTRVLSRVLQEDVNLIGAGRTDSGVHARGQVANFRTHTTLDLPSLLQALNGLLPDDICVRSAEDVPEDFHARFDARERFYRYYVSLRPVAITRKYQWYVKSALDREMMSKVAAEILGEHDFNSFCRQQSEVHHYRCSVMQSEWVTHGDSLVYEIRANRFLHGMVRALVGTMVDIGRGYLSGAVFGEILAAKDRTAAGPAAPARGLFLEEVVY
jgi:tRNA pseudouridine38-40 synthase